MEIKNSLRIGSQITAK